MWVKLTSPSTAGESETHKHEHRERDHERNIKDDSLKEAGWWSDVE